MSGNNRWPANVYQFDYFSITLFKPYFSVVKSKLGRVWQNIVFLDALVFGATGYLMPLFSFLICWRGTTIWNDVF